MAILLPLPPYCWNYRCKPIHTDLFNLVLLLLKFNKAQIDIILGLHSIRVIMQILPFSFLLCPLKGWLAISSAWGRTVVSSWLDGLQSKNEPLNNSQEHVLEYNLRPRERFQSVKLLPCKQEVCSSIPQHSNTLAWQLTSATPVLMRAETGRSLELIGQQG